ncbi:MAG TPA: MraY family glycosyltransferase [Fervidobacterium sp.]|nr:MraY family glycosyltransferase [Fervidobacterium sp.]HPT54825.1 MraY family glycosyltransferase [Fervidobacterium sp.]HPZ17184.1 MraY family glycosyltransferase [Fervidobacterium sp.]HQE48258.1 MraY family glycosyltransferase [Fervidobacterium sp.]HUM42023.1 MraY family glycosyltransferase [Fervidobacterium sp.]
MSSIMLLIISFIITTITIPLFGRMAYKYNIVDKPDGVLKPHERVTPYLGGISIFLAVVFTTPFDLITKLSLTLLVLTGLIDDVRTLSPRIRLLVEFVVSILLTFKYIGINLLSPVYIIAIVTLINAVNMMDGMDGICASVSLISAVGLLFTVTSNYDKLLLFALIGALFGYLIYNFPPARIFMGDAGSYLIGGILSIAVLSSGRRGDYTVVSAIIFVSIFFFDLIAGFTRRILNGRSPFNGDRDHIYDKIQNRLQDSRKTLFVVIGIQLIIFLAGYISRQSAIMSVVSSLFVVIIYFFIGKVLGILKQDK